MTNAKYTKCALLVLIAMALVIMPDMAYANGIQSPMGNAICVAAAWVLGNAGRGLAILAIMIIGVGATLGKVSWGMAMVVGIGISIIFGAGYIATSLGGFGGVLCGFEAR